MHLRAAPRSKEIDRLGAMFRALDHDGDGWLSAGDLREGLGAVGAAMDSASVKALARDLDVAGCGSVNLEVRRRASFGRRFPRGGASLWSRALPMGVGRAEQPDAALQGLPPMVCVGAAVSLEALGAVAGRLPDSCCCSGTLPCCLYPARIPCNSRVSMRPSPR